MFTLKETEKRSKEMGGIKGNEWKGIIKLDKHFLIRCNKCGKVLPLKEIVSRGKDFMEIFVSEHDCK